MLDFNRTIDMLKVSLILSAALIISSCASSIPKPNASDIDFDNVVTKDGEKLICKSERITGSHIKTKTCMTAAEIAKAKRDSEMFMDKMKIKSMESCVRGCG